MVAVRDAGLGVALAEANRDVSEALACVLVLASVLVLACMLAEEGLGLRMPVKTPTGQDLHFLPATGFCACEIDSHLAVELVVREFDVHKLACRLC